MSSGDTYLITVFKSLLGSCYTNRLKRVFKGWQAATWGELKEKQIAANEFSFIDAPKKERRLGIMWLQIHKEKNMHNDANLVTPVLLSKRP